MKTLGALIVIGVLLWIFIVTLPFLWWLWLLLVWLTLLGIGSLKKKVKTTTETQGATKYKNMIEILDNLQKNKE